MKTIIDENGVSRQLSDVEAEDLIGDTKLTNLRLVHKDRGVNHKIEFAVPADCRDISAFLWYVYKKSIPATTHYIDPTQYDLEEQVDDGSSTRLDSNSPHYRSFLRFLVDWIGPEYN